MTQKQPSGKLDRVFVGASWEGAEEEGIRYFRALTFAQKFKVIEQMCEVAAAIMPREALEQMGVYPRNTRLRLKVNATSMSSRMVTSERVRRRTVIAGKISSRQKALSIQ